ncbi:hypothetical protein [Mucilaginibacter lappiensis]|uniref:Uncharacterized protein n=1 Tax=Mucilaginibacter lappiensis TaxID=354630 RepID=A0A841JVE9_9SPHI|nr:hypothetical protein [Mucilaginibacter lappiensis]MBB6131791.1 hypothetical protein [Mucilaginibacter lappiensis]
MGEIAEMMINGILDANGEFTGNDYGHPVYPKGWFGKKVESSSPKVARVKNFLSIRGIAQGESQKDILKAYANHVGIERPTNHACSNWPTFKAFVDQKIGYVKPSKQNK